MYGTANMKLAVAGALATCAIAGVSLMAAPVATAAASTAAGTHVYNPDAALGSVDNPIILSGGSPLLTEAQRKPLEQAKEQLASGKGNVKSTAGVQSNVHTVLQPDFNNCDQSGFYYCNAVNSTIGNVEMGTVLDSNSHENASAEGLGRGSNNWGVYLDQSRNGGATWKGHINELINGTEWSNLIYDGPGFYDRACITDYQHNLVYCLPWH
jgi:hypothetical protein